jgi:hypothetical protein
MACHYLFIDFHSRGDDLYLHRWAESVDHLADRGWEVINSARKPGVPYHWTVCLFCSGPDGLEESGGPGSCQTTIDID